MALGVLRAIDTNTFAAVEAAIGSTVTEEYLGFKPSFPFVEVNTYTDHSPEVQGFIVSAEAIKANEFCLFQSGNERAQ